MRLQEEKCPYCHQLIDWQNLYAESELMSIARQSDEYYTPALCCDEFTQDFMESSDSYAADTWYRCASAAADNTKVRSIFEDNDKFYIDFSITIKLLDKPGNQKLAKQFIADHHRHNLPPSGWRFGMGMYNGPDLIGIVWTGRPVARKLDQNQILEVNRLCVRTDVPRNFTRNACSQGYGAAAREAKNRGFSRIITYTLITEPGTSLRAVQWEHTATTAPGKDWNRKKRPRKITAPTCAKLRWEKVLHPRNPRPAQQPKSNKKVESPEIPVTTAPIAEANKAA